jgi:hypothetical protein
MMLSGAEAGIGRGRPLAAVRPIAKPVWLASRTGGITLRP